VNVGAGGLREAQEKVLGQFRLKISHFRSGNFSIANAMWPPAEIDRGDCQSFIHWHDEVSSAQDAALRSERFRDCFAEGDSGVFNGVMLIHVEIAFRLDFQIEGTVPRDQFEHVVQEAYAGANLCLPAAIEVKAQTNICFVRPAMNGCDSRHGSATDTI
jgi:hypothetical protein